jgi:hypothetical protein
MRRIAALMVFLIASAMFLVADDKASAGAEMTGYICSSKCVVQNAAQSSCKPDCTEKGGDTVFVDDQGKVTKIANPKMAKSHMNKKVKMKGQMKSDNLTIMEVFDWHPGPG